MAKDTWQTKTLAVANLYLDVRNPRLGRESFSQAPRDIIQYLFEHDKALDVAESIASHGYFPNEPLLAVKEGGRHIVVEGNRRLAALKALREPALLEGHHERKVERLSRKINRELIAKVPVIIAPRRRDTDRQMAGRHIRTPVLAWQAENRASFILDKLQEGYDNDELRDALGFSLSDIQEARQTRAVAEMARSLDLPEEVMAKLHNPRAKLFTTLERVFDSLVGRKYLRIESNPIHGLRGTTTKKEFLRGFKKLVTDVALGKQTSRTLNSNENIEAYFKQWASKELPAKKRGTFVPADIITGKSFASVGGKQATPPPRRPKQKITTFLPKDFRVIFGNERIKDIRLELTNLKREKFPNAGSILLRVFFELAVKDYLERTGDLKKLTEKLRKINKLRGGKPTMEALVKEIKRIAKGKLPSNEFKNVNRALKYDPAAAYSLRDLNAFVHSAKDIPTAQGILEFWTRAEPLFRLMLEQDPESTKK